MHDELEENIYTDYVLKHSGVVGTGCVPNNDVPQDKRNCVSGSTEFFRPIFKGYTAAFFKGDVNAVKDAVVRFGAVNLDDFGVIIGWENNYWVIATPVRAHDDDPRFNYVLKDYIIKMSEKNFEGEVLINAGIIKVDCAKDPYSQACSSECAIPSDKSI